MVNEFDLGEMLAERAQPKSKVYVYLNEAASYAKAELMEAAKTAKGDKAAEIEAAILKANNELEATKYTFELTAIPSRMREDIASKAMHEFPLKYAAGSFVDENAMDRLRRDNNLTWAAQIESITNPAGHTNRDFSLEDIEKLALNLPTHAQEQIDDAISALTKKAEEYTASTQELDFL